MVSAPALPSLALHRSNRFDASLFLSMPHLPTSLEAGNDPQHADSGRYAYPHPTWNGGRCGTSLPRIARQTGRAAGHRNRPRRPEKVARWRLDAKAASPREPLRSRPSRCRYSMPRITFARSLGYRATNSMRSLRNQISHYAGFQSLPGKLNEGVWASGRSLRSIGGGRCSNGTGWRGTGSSRTGPRTI